MHAWPNLIQDKFDQSLTSKLALRSLMNA
jgi:hypothetical protein